MDNSLEQSHDTLTSLWLNPRYSSSNSVANIYIFEEFIPFQIVMFLSINVPLLSLKELHFISLIRTFIMAMVKVEPPPSSTQVVYVFPTPGLSLIFTCYHVATST